MRIERWESNKKGNLDGILPTPAFLAQHLLKWKNISIQLELLKIFPSFHKIYVAGPVVMLKPALLTGNMVKTRSLREFYLFHFCHGCKP